MAGGRVQKSFSRKLPLFIYSQSLRDDKGGHSAQPPFPVLATALDPFITGQIFFNKIIFKFCYFRVRLDKTISGPSAAARTGPRGRAPRLGQARGPGAATTCPTLTMHIK